MTPPREWLNPPRSLLASLFLLTLVSVTTLGFFGWKLLAQERDMEAQRARERVETAAARIAATVKETLAETGDRVGAWLMSPPKDARLDDGVLLLVSDDNLSAYPSGRLLYRPSAPAGPDTLAGAFADGEVIEFQLAEPDKAIDWYRRHMAESRDPNLRAGALVRLARIYRRARRLDEARAAYAQLAQLSSARIAGDPADLIARHALCELSGSRSDAATLQHDLLNGRWPLTRGQFEFYWDEAGRLSGTRLPAPPDSAALSEAVGSAWPDLVRDQSPRGQLTLWLSTGPYFVIWRGVPSQRAILVTRPAAVLDSVFSAEQVDCAAVDEKGRLVAGRKDRRGYSAVSPPSETQLPWTLYVSEASPGVFSGMSASQRFLVIIMAVMVAFLVAGASFIARAIRRDSEVSRMQSDFVSAVSHEFRSPLTSIRQLSEILALGRVPSDGRRQVYYDTLVRETTRLQRLVEALLNFGRMEAGARQYHFEELDASTLVERVVGEFETQIADTGRHIEIEPAATPCPIDADPESLSVALRNLIDNALKYSPDCPTVWVGWSLQNQRVAIRVRDRGVGIAASERRAIFRKFVRGSAAAAANVKGSGVGLSMVRHIVAAHGGEITLSSEPGQGSTFTILLPTALQRATVGVQ